MMEVLAGGGGGGRARDGEGARVKGFGGDVKLICTILSSKSHEIEKTSIQKGVGVGGGRRFVGGWEILK